VARKVDVQRAERATIINPWVAFLLEFPSLGQTAS